MSTEIYFFSGTGNSLHVARELQKRIPGSNLIPVVRLLRRDEIKSNSDTVGFVFPSFCVTIPIPVHDFLKKADLSSVQYIFAVCTRGGSPSQAFEYMNAILKKQGKKLHAHVNINMPWNIPLGPENDPGAVSEERIQHLESEMQNKLDLFSKHILAHEEHTIMDTDAIYELPLSTKVLSSIISKASNYELHRYMYQDLIHFYSDLKCTGCGVCEKVCLSNKVRIINKRPVWKGAVKCFACFACINFCPEQAIQIQSRFPIRSHTEVNGRYHHTSIRYNDIVEQR